MSPPALLGWMAAAAATLIGAVWQLASRHGVTTTLGPLELAALRYGVPGLLLAPVAVRAWPRLRGLGVRHAGTLVAGGGLPFGLLALAGAQFAPVAHMAVFMAGAMPLFTSLGAWLVERDRPSPARIAGLVVIAVGVVAIGWPGTGTAGAWRGDLLFLAAAAAWSAHTIAFRRSGLTPYEGTAVCNLASALALPLVFVIAGPPRLADASVGDVALQLACQGFLAGVLGLLAYMLAVERLGSARASLSGAAVPLVSATGGMLFLREPLTATGALCIALVAAGIVMASPGNPAATGIAWRKR